MMDIINMLHVLYMFHFCSVWFYCCLVARCFSLSLSLARDSLLAPATFAATLLRGWRWNLQERWPLSELLLSFYALLFSLLVPLLGMIRSIPMESVVMRQRFSWTMRLPSGSVFILPA